MQEQVTIRMIAIGLFAIIYYIGIIIQKNKQTEREKELIQQIPYDFIEKCEQIESNIEYDKKQLKKLENTNKICEIEKKIIIWILAITVLMERSFMEKYIPNNTCYHWNLSHNRKNTIE